MRATPFRTKNAHQVLADFLPDDLCEKCVEPEGYTGRSDRHVYRVIHYNDFHCTGGQLLINMMNLAADRGEIAVADRRKILTGLPA